MSFLLNELFDPENISLDLRSTTGGEAVWEIIEMMKASGSVAEAALFYDAVMKREKSASTATEGGVAFPHARTNLVSKITLGIGRSRAGVTFTDPLMPVHLIFVIGVPQLMVSDYLICIGALARLLNDEERRFALMRASSQEEFLEHLRED
jgi:PTS system fructose-specific IIA component